MAKKRPVKKSSPSAPVIWPVDVFDDNQVYLDQVGAAIRSISPHPPAVQLTYVLDFVEESKLPHVSAGTHRKWKSHFGTKAREGLNAIVKKLDWKGPLKAEVLTKGTASRRQSVDVLLKYAKSKKAGLIAVGSHARKGLSRLFLGSFAETLITSARLPVLVVSPEAKVASRVSKILFSTDFSDASKKAYLKVLELAKSLDAEVVLFHKKLSSVEPVIQSGVYMLGGGWVSTAQFLEEDEKAKIELSKKWTSEGLKKGVKVEYVTAHADLGIADAVCETAKQKNADLVIVVNQTGRWGTILLGSVSREVVRRAPCPVLVLHV